MFCKKTVIIYEYPAEAPCYDINKQVLCLAWVDEGPAMLATFCNGIFTEEHTLKEFKAKYWTDIPNLQRLK